MDVVDCVPTLVKEVAALLQEKDLRLRFPLEELDVLLEPEPDLEQAGAATNINLVEDQDLTDDDKGAVQSSDDEAEDNLSEDYAAGEADCDEWKIYRTNDVLSFIQALPFFFMTGTVSTRVQWAWLFRQWKTGRPASLWCRRWCGRDWHYSTGWTNRTGFWPCLRRCRDVPTKSATRAVSKVLARSGRRVRVRPTHSSSWSAQAASGCGRSTSS